MTWAPKVFELARHYGLVLLEGGRLVDTMAGETVPPGAMLQQPPDATTMAALATPAAGKLAGCVVAARDFVANPASPLARDGVEEIPLITPAATGDGFSAGPISGWWRHGFNLRALRMASGASVPSHTRSEAEVIMLHEGVLEITTDKGTVLLGPGDCFTTPVGMKRAFRATSSEAVLAYVVRGGDMPAAPEFVA